MTHQEIIEQIDEALNHGGTSETDDALLAARNYIVERELG